VAIENLSIDEIERQLEQLAQEQSGLARALEERRHQAKYDLAEQIKEMIAEQGYEVEEITPLIAARRRRAAVSAKQGTARQYTKYIDPDNPANVYVRGVIPGWMKAKMQEQGYDPSSKEDRETFKASSLQAVA
jgi:DNA-binding protein H-NS